MAARRPYRMTPARKAAIRKAQLASARKRKGSGKAKPVSMRRRAAQASAGGIKKRRAAAPKNTTRRTKAAPANNRKRNLRRIAAVSAAVAAAGGAAYTYKNREKMIIAPMAERSAIKAAKSRAKAQGHRLTKSEINSVRMQERKDHAQRSTFRTREYMQARRFYQEASRRGKNIRPMQSVKISTLDKIILASTGNLRSARSISGKNSTHNAAVAIGLQSQQYWYATYRKDVNARATHRLNKIKGNKKSFDYKSGKVKKVIGGRVYRMPF